MMAKTQSKTSSKDIQPAGWRYVGRKGTFVPGLPPRDVSYAEAVRKDIVDALEAHPQYKAVPGAAPVTDTED